MELLEGETLSLLMEREGPLLAPRALKLIRQACRAIAEAHAAGIVHRDIKPDNLFVTTLGGEVDFIKVLDFGIAKLMDDKLRDTKHVTVEGSLLGTPAYMSPEQFEGQAIDARADVFSLGAVLYYMLTGEPPFRGSTLAAIRGAHFQPVKRPSELTGTPVSAALEDIIVRCLAREPAERYENAGELDLALCAISQDVAPPPSAVPPASAQGAQSSGDELVDDALAESSAKIGVVERVREPGREPGGLFDVPVIERTSDK
jgi:serine/threonine-protein kinase